MRLRARAVLTILSQSRLGLREGSVMISTMSPFLSGVPSGMSRPLILAPAQWCPTLLWMWKAKSSGVAPSGSSFTSPAGV